LPCADDVDGGLWAVDRHGVDGDNPRIPRARLETA
jgi:hypothetical protein